jgi:hypothetical protein
MTLPKANGPKWFDIDPDELETIIETKTDFATQLAQIVTTKISDYGVSVDKTGLNADTTTQAIINAAKSGKRVIFPEGTYAINQTIIFSQFTEFISSGKVTFKIVSDVDVFWITADNKISDFTIDLQTLNSYTRNIFEVSSASRNTLTNYNQGSQYTCKIEKINLMFSNNNTVDTISTVFNIWAKPTDSNNVSYPSFATGFFNILIKDIYVHGAFAYFMRNWTWNTNYYVSASDVKAWITGITIEDVSLFGSFLYGIFDAPNETAILDEHYRGLSPMWVTNMRLQYGNRVKRFAFLTDGIRVFKDCIPWDFPGASITFLYRTLATYIIKNRPYVNMDNGYGSRYYFFDVVDSNGNLVSDTNTKQSWIDSRLVNYRDGSAQMNVLTEALTFQDSPIIIKKTGYKSWQIIRASNNTFIFAPSTSNDGVDWDYSKQVTINGDDGTLYASTYLSSPNIKENGILLSNKYAPKMVSNPASATSPGTTGQMSIDGGYIYVCVATNTWKRVSLTSW